MRFVEVFALLLGLMDISNGLRCLSCSSTTSLQKCYANGVFKNCWQRGQVCYTEFRYERPSQSTGIYRQKLVTAGCKQSQACFNEEDQNPSNCYHDLGKIPQRCYRCCKLPNCFTIRVERSRPLCQAAIQKFFKRFDVNDDGIVHALEAKLQAEKRKMKSLAFFATLLADNRGFNQKGANLQAFRETMGAWLEELKMVADRNGNGKISLTEFQLFISDHQKLSHLNTSLSKEEILNEFARVVSTGLELDLCQFMETYTSKIFDTFKVIECKPEIGVPMFGTKFCTNGNQAGSECWFSCQPGYHTIGADRVTCSEGGQWQGKAPDCKLIECIPNIKAPKFGTKICSNGNQAGSECRFSCRPGYRMIGSDRVTCSEEGKWQGKAPDCKLIACEPDIGTPKFGTKFCTSGNQAGSNCRFSCRPGYLRIGADLVTCSKEGQWQGKAPDCKLIKCIPNIRVPNFGTKLCTSGNQAGSECRFSCRPGYRMIGSDRVTCSEEGKWQGKVPDCKPIECNPMLEAPKGGKLACSNSNFAFSQCQVTCDADEGYKLSGSATSSSCTEEATWTPLKACCSRLCPPYAKVDLILIFDSSSSVGTENWKKLIAFGKRIVGTFNVGSDSVRVGAFRYNKHVDVRTEVQLGEVNTFEELKTRFDNIPYNGSGTLTGQALQHACDYSLNVEGNRPDIRDVLLLFTDGASKDDAVEPATQLKEKGVEVNVIAIENQFGRFDDAHMKRVASNPTEDHVMVISGGFDALTKKFVDVISKLLCGEPCKHLRT